MNSEKNTVSNSEAGIFSCEIVAFDKELLKAEAIASLKKFGRGCCESAKQNLAPLGQDLVCYFIDWVGQILFQ